MEVASVRAACCKSAADQSSHGGAKPGRLMKLLVGQLLRDGILSERVVTSQTCTSLRVLVQSEGAAHGHTAYEWDRRVQACQLFAVRIQPIGEVD